MSEHYQVKPTSEEIEAVADWAIEGLNQGTRLAGMSYEEGVDATIRWMLGWTDERPDE